MRNYLQKNEGSCQNDVFMEKRYYNSNYCSDKGVNGTIVNLACMGGGLNFVLEKINVFCKKYLRCICAC